MSRTRIVKGKYTKIVGGNYNISAEGNIISNASAEVRENGIDKGVFYGNYERVGSEVSDDFDLNFSQKKDGIYATIVPLGILDFEGNFENSFFAFNYSLYLGNVDSLSFEVLNEEGISIYSITNLPEIVVTAKRHPKMLEDITKNKPEFNPAKPVNIWDWKPTYNPFVIPVADYTKIGTYVILWDGFDNNDIYNSTNFNNKTLKVKITGRKGDKIKSKEIEIKTSECRINWVDVKIDKKNKKIDTTLRVDLQDGGENGLKCSSSLRGARDETHWEESCPWDRIAATDLIPGKPPIKTRTKNFADLEKLAIEGLNYHWGRNRNHAEAKDVKIIGEAYEVYINAVNTDKKSMDDLSLVYNTNGDWMRSGNPGSATGNPISWVGNLISREAICYNVGYIKYSNGWGYQPENEEDIEYKETSAHEIGHEILKFYGGTVYSYGHKGSVNVVTQSNSNASTNYPIIGEIDIMPYYKNYIPINGRMRMAAAEKDVLSLIWLTKLKIK